MANELRTRTNFVGGLVEDNPLTNVATTLTSAGLAALPVIDTTNHAAIILDPDGIHGAPEIVWVTAHSASSTTATILRAQESTSARQHLRDTYWVHTATVADFASPAIIQSQTEAGTTDTLDLDDIGQVVRYTSGSAVTVTVPDNATTAFPVGSVINLYAAGAGGVTIAPAGGVTIHNNGAALVQYQEVSLRKDGTDVWVRVG